MFSAANKGRFTSVPQFESLNAHNSTGDIPLRPRPVGSQIHEPTGYQGFVDDSLGSSPRPAGHLLDHPAAKPRRGENRAFWRNPWSLETAAFLGDSILLVAPCVFLILAFEALTVHNKPISAHGKAVEQAARLGPTLFPIIFAAVVGRMMRTCALWRAERGAPLGLLEQLNGSQNLLAAIERAVLLPGLGLLSVAVVFLWALSPVGGQSALRVLERGNHSTFGNATLYYFNNTGDGINGAFTGASSYSSYETSLNAVFQAALASLKLVNGSDIWGNIKIPVLQSIESYQAGQAKDGWYDFDEASYTDPYSALNGLVVSGLQDGITTNYSIESSYFNLTCTDPVFFDRNGTSGWGGFDKWVGSLFQRGTNSSLLFDGLYANSNVGLSSYMVDTNYNHTPKSDPDPKYNIIYASLGDGSGLIAAYNCTMGVVHVESDISCSSSNCQVRRLRPSQKIPLSTSGWPFPTESITLPAHLLEWLGTAMGQHHSGVVSPVDYYVSGYDYPFQVSPFGTGNFAFDNVTGEFLGKRLQSLLNTGWQLATQNAATVQKPSTNMTALHLSTNMSTADVFEGGVGYPVTATQATTQQTHEIFVASRPWVTVTIVVSFVLLFCGMANMFFKYGSHSPDILGFVSSMTRDNSNFGVIPGGDRLDGLARARAMKHVQVQIADVRPWDAEGHITLRNLGLRDRMQKL